MDGASTVRARGVSKHFDDVIALDEIDLDVAPGQVHGLVGPNAAGKTTLLGLLLGLTTADTGSLEVLGSPLRRGAVVPEGVAGFVDGPGLYPWLTARQNLAAVADLCGRGRGGVADALAEVGLTDVADDRVRGFSLGMRQRLGLASALLLRPQVLVLDEPSNGLDPAGARHVHRVLTGLAAGGASVILSSHRMDDLAAMCHEVTVLRSGRVVFSGPVGKLADGTAELDHRLRTSDTRAARRVVGGTPGVRLLTRDDRPPERGPGADDELLVRGAVAAVDDLGLRLAAAGVSIRELAPAVPPLEAAFLALTADLDADADADADEPGVGEGSR